MANARPWDRCCWRAVSASTQGGRSAQRSENGYRCYNQADINRLVLLRRLRLLGVPLETLKPLLRDASDAQCLEVQQEVLQLIGERLVAIDQEMSELRLL